jgi:hypothetical protein
LTVSRQRQEGASALPLAHSIALLTGGEFVGSVDSNVLANLPEAKKPHSQRFDVRQGPAKTHPLVLAWQVFANFWCWFSSESPCISNMAY